MGLQESIYIETQGRGLYNITRQVQACVKKTTQASLCNVFIHHTSASLIICENADPDVQTDLENFMARLVLDGDKLFIHTTEGPDDMSAHVRTVLTQTSIAIPIIDGQLALGTWQNIFIWEHRYNAHHRKITVTIV